MDQDTALGRLLLSHCDLPKGWSLRVIQDDDEHHENCLFWLGSFSRALGKYRGESQGLTGPSGNVNAYPMLADDADSMKSLMGTVEVNSEDWGLEFALVGDGLVVVASTDKNVTRSVFDLYASRFAHSVLSEARSLIRGKKFDEAGKLLEMLAKSSRVAPRTKALAADLYLDLEPPKAAEALALCEEAAKEAGAKCGTWGACARGRAKALLGKLDEAKAELSIGLKDAESEGYRALTKVLGAMALVNSKTGSAAECGDLLARALELESRFGGNAVALMLGSQQALRSTVGEDRLKPLLAPFQSKKPVELFTDPAPGVSLSKIDVLVLPPVFRKGLLRKDFWETDIEAGLAKPFGKRGYVFSRDQKRKLEAPGLHEVAVPICRTAGEMAGELWQFHLDSMRGGDATMSSIAAVCLAQGRAQGLYKKDPDCVLAICGNVDKGKGDSNSCQFRAALLDVQSGKLAAYVECSFECKEKDLDKVMKKAGEDAYKKMLAGLK